MRPDAARADSRIWPEGGARRPDAYGDSTIPGR
jgi:hypothetical protein